jgi:diaminopimelate decarboxylase
VTTTSRSSSYNKSAFPQGLSVEALEAMDAEASEAILNSSASPRSVEADAVVSEAGGSVLLTEMSHTTRSQASFSQNPMSIEVSLKTDYSTPSYHEDGLPVSHARLSASAFDEAAPTNPSKPEHPLQGSMIAPLSFNVQQGKVSLGGVLLDELADAYGTPLYVLDGQTLRQNARDYTQTLAQTYGDNYLVVYACKANLSMGLCKLLEQEGMGLDVVSAGELYTAIKAGFPPERIIMNGNNKTAADIAMALNYGIYRLIVDNASELPLIAAEAKRLGKVANVMLRVAPGIECHTHDYIKTGQNDSKFGFPLEQLSAVVDSIINEYSETISLKGFQAHVGSQIFELKAYEDLAKILLNITYNVQKAYNITLTDLDVGGGLGIAYTSADDPQPIPVLVKKVVNTIKAYAEKLELPLPRLMMEPGRSLVARAGVTLYSVGSRKDLEGYASFVAVDGGMGDNIRPALYQAEYTAIVANKLNQPNAAPVRIVGKYCESGDVLLRHFEGPDLERGDTIMVFGTGAYNYTMSSNYNRFPRPAMVLVEEGKSALLLKRESLDDLLAMDLIPDWLLG